MIEEVMSPKRASSFGRVVTEEVFGNDEKVLKMSKAMPIVFPFKVNDL